MAAQRDLHRFADIFIVVVLGTIATTLQGCGKRDCPEWIDVPHGMAQFEHIPAKDGPGKFIQRACKCDEGYGPKVYPVGEPQSQFKLNAIPNHNSTEANAMCATGFEDNDAPDSFCTKCHDTKNPIQIKNGVIKIQSGVPADEIARDPSKSKTTCDDGYHPKTYKIEVFFAKEKPTCLVYIVSDDCEDHGDRLQTPLPDPLAKQSTGYAGKTEGDEEVEEVEAVTASSNSTPSNSTEASLAGLHATSHVGVEQKSAALKHHSFHTQPASLYEQAYEHMAASLHDLKQKSYHIMTGYGHPEYRARVYNAFASSLQQMTILDLTWWNPLFKAFGQFGRQSIARSAAQTW